MSIVEPCDSSRRAGCPRLVRVAPSPFSKGSGPVERGRVAGTDSRLRDSDDVPRLPSVACFRFSAWVRASANLAVEIAYSSMSGVTMEMQGPRGR